MIGSFFLVKGEIQASTNDIWNYFEYTPTDADASLGFTALITGELASTRAYVNIFDTYVSDGETMYFQLKSGTLKDCISTEVKTKAQWGIPEEPDWQEVIINWTGTECAVTASTFYEIKAVNITDPANNLPVQGAWSDAGAPNTPLGQAGTTAQTDTSTRFFELTPGNGETRATSTENSLYADLYLNVDDYIDGSYIRLGYVEKEVLEYASVANTDLLWTYFVLNDVVTSGYNFVSTTTGSLGNEGEYYFKAELFKPSSTWTTVLSWFNPFTNINPNIITSTTTKFIYGERTGLQQFMASSTSDESLNNWIASTTTSIQDVKEYCSLSTSFSLTDCVYALFLPSNGDMQAALENIKSNITNKFPIGYFSDFISIISTSTVGNLVILDVTTPTGLGLGSTGSLRLDLTGVLDPFLNATTGKFSNISSSSTASSTLYETTSYYWNIIVYILTLFYILSRIIGSQVIPHGGLKNKENLIK